jgi:peptidoglycan/LPS O-acetylase OafA/YrhL
MSSLRSNDKFPILDGLRALSILLVLACHLLPLGPKALRLNETAGAMGMSLFFALSGFLITSGLMKNPQIYEFLVRRLARILPLAYAYTAVVFLIFSFNPKALLWTNLFAVNYLIQYLDTGWTNHFWSLCVEMQFYLVIAIVVSIFGRRGLWLVWLACLAVTLLRINEGAYIAIETHLRVDEILSGACVATIYPNRVMLRGALMLMIMATLLWAISAWPLADALQYFRPYTTALLLLTALHYGATNSATFLASRPMRYIATISYALYVIHPATAYGWMNDGSSVTRYLLKRPISFALTFILAHISTFYWERWWQSAAKRWLGKRRPVSSVEGKIIPTAPLH